ncbi:MAG: rhodanese-like domain-containing protein [Alphaproteobacteria bacterium]|nr:rhodanese-like domain-containing protein [Alphaproteobacteria bacterium]
MEYAGDVDVTETWRRLSEDPNAVLIDVRTTAELNFVGLPDLSSLDKQVQRSEWKSLPGMALNPEFKAGVEQAGIARDAAIFLLCRSGQRSRDAAILLTAAGYQHCYNVAGGFEGDKDTAGHRGTVGGWKFAGLPWTQG